MRLRKNSVFRVCRGGSSFFESGYLRCSNRYMFTPGVRNRIFGFRFVVRGRDEAD